MSLESGVTLCRLNHVLFPEPGNPMASTTIPFGGRAGAVGTDGEISAACGSAAASGSASAKSGADSSALATGSSGILPLAAGREGLERRPVRGHGLRGHGLRGGGDVRAATLPRRARSASPASPSRLGARVRQLHFHFPMPDLFDIWRAPERTRRLARALGREPARLQNMPAARAEAPAAFLLPQVSFSTLYAVAHPFTHVRRYNRVGAGGAIVRSPVRTTDDRGVQTCRARFQRYPRAEIHLADHVSQKRSGSCHSSVVWRRRWQALRDDARRYGQVKAHSE